MKEKFYLQDLRQQYHIKYKTSGLKLKLEKYFVVQKENYPPHKLYIFAEQKEIDAIMQQFVNALDFKVNKDPIDYFNTKLDGMDKTHYEFLFKTIKEYTINYFSKSKAKNLIYQADPLIKIIELYMENFKKDANELTNKDIFLLLQLPFNNMQTQLVSYYIKYILENYKDEIKFTSSIGVVNDRKVKDDTYFYSKEEWFNYVDYLTNIDLHIEKAYKNKSYAKYWLFYLLHLSLAWRKSDILSIPGFDNLDIEKYTLDWFMENEFKFDDALYIISNAKKFCEQHFTNKTNQRLHFNIPLSLMMSTSIAIIIQEQYRRNDKENELFPSKNFQLKTKHKFFNGVLDEFSTLKANRTLLSLVNEKEDEMTSSAIGASSYMRSHKMKSYKVSNSTMVYLNSTYDDKQLAGITQNLFDKGPFGWLFDYVVATFDDEPIQKSYDMDFLESTSKYLLSEKCKREVVMKEVLSLTKEQLNNILYGKNISKNDYVYCIKEDCEKHLNNNCLECQYSIPTIFALYSIKDEIEKLLYKIESLNANNQNDKTRYMYRLLKLLSIVKEFQNAYGEDALNAFLPFDVIMNQTQKLLKGGT